MIIELSKFILPTLKAVDSKTLIGKGLEPVKVVFFTPEHKKEFDNELNSEIIFKVKLIIYGYNYLLINSIADFTAVLFGEWR